MTEDIIALAKKMQIKSDSSLEKEMQNMKKLHSQIRQDLHHFVEQREKKPWRNWQIHGVFYKPEIDNKDISVSEVSRDIETNLR